MYKKTYLKKYKIFLQTNLPENFFLFKKKNNKRKKIYTLNAKNALNVLNKNVFSKNKINFSFLKKIKYKKLHKKYNLNINKYAYKKTCLKNLNKLFLFSLYNIKFLFEKKKTRASEFKNKLKEKKKLCLLYGNLSNKYIRKIIIKAKKNYGNKCTAENLICLLEKRLDVVLYRALFFPSISSAKNYIKINKINVNNQYINIPSYNVKNGDIISVCKQNRKNVSNNILKYLIKNNYINTLYTKKQNINKKNKATEKENKEKNILLKFFEKTNNLHLKNNYKKIFRILKNILLLDFIFKQNLYLYLQKIYTLYINKNTQNKYTKKNNLFNFLKKKQKENLKKAKKNNYICVLKKFEKFKYNLSFFNIYKYNVNTFLQNVLYNKKNILFNNFYILYLKKKIYLQTQMQNIMHKNKKNIMHFEAFPFKKINFIFFKYNFFVFYNFLKNKNYFFIYEKTKKETNKKLYNFLEKNLKEKNFFFFNFFKYFYNVYNAYKIKKTFKNYKFNLYKIFLKEIKFYNIKNINKNYINRKFYENYILNYAKYNINLYSFLFFDTIIQKNLNIINYKLKMKKKIMHILLHFIFKKIFKHKNVFKQKQRYILKNKYFENLMCIVLPLNFILVKQNINLLIEKFLINDLYKYNKNYNFSFVFKHKSMLKKKAYIYINNVNKNIITEIKKIFDTYSYINKNNIKHFLNYNNIKIYNYIKNYLNIKNKKENIFNENVYLKYDFLFFLKLKKFFKFKHNNNFTKNLNIINIKPLNMEISYKTLTIIYLYKNQKLYFPCTVDVDLVLRYYI